MNKRIDFAPGPSQLYFSVEDHTRRAFREGFLSISHRSKDFQNAYQHTVSNLRKLMGVPDHFHICIYYFCQRGVGALYPKFSHRQLFALGEWRIFKKIL